MKVIGALCAMALCVSANPPFPDYLHDEAAVVQVKCRKPNGITAGSAFKVSRDTYITAAHVLMGGTCYVEGQLVQLTGLNLKEDYASFRGPANDTVMAADCSGFRQGETYLARGFPGGSSYKIAAPWLATGFVQEGFNVFFGDAIPGMSGGPLIDERGVAVGLVAMHSPTRAMPLVRTGYCQGDALGGWSGNHEL